MEGQGHFFGACSMTIVAVDRDARRLDQTVATCVKVFAGHDGSLHEERYNLLNAWLVVVPGNGAHNLRRLPLLNTNVADLSFLRYDAEHDRYQTADLRNECAGQECVSEVQP